MGYSVHTTRKVDHEPCKHPLPIISDKYWKWSWIPKKLASKPFTKTLGGLSHQTLTTWLKNTYNLYTLAMSSLKRKRFLRPNGTIPAIFQIWPSRNLGTTVLQISKKQILPFLWSSHWCVSALLLPPLLFFEGLLVNFDKDLSAQVGVQYNSSHFPGLLYFYRALLSLRLL